MAGAEAHRGRPAPLVRVETRGGIATVVLERPEAINAISTALATAVAEAFERVSLMVSGEQMTPGGNDGQVTTTFPVNPVGVTVIVEVPAPPAVTAALEPAIVKLGCTTMTEIFFAPLNGA